MFTFEQTLIVPITFEHFSSQDLATKTKENLKGRYDKSKTVLDQANQIRFLTSVTWIMFVWTEKYVSYSIYAWETTCEGYMSKAGELWRQVQCFDDQRQLLLRGNR